MHLSQITTGAELEADSAKYEEQAAVLELLASESRGDRINRWESRARKAQAFRKLRALHGARVAAEIAAAIR